MATLHRARTSRGGKTQWKEDHATDEEPSKASCGGTSISVSEQRKVSEWPKSGYRGKGVVMSISVVCNDHGSSGSWTPAGGRMGKGQRPCGGPLTGDRSAAWWPRGWGQRWVAVEGLEGCVGDKTSRIRRRVGYTK